MAYVDNSDHMSNSYSMSQRNFRCTIKIVFSPSGSDIPQQLNYVIFVRGKICSLSFQTLSGEQFDPRPGRSQDRPTPSLGGRPGAT
jgi:hypothetical protein